MRIKRSSLWVAGLLMPASLLQAQLGMFEGQADVGTVLHAGSTKYDAAKKTYTLTASGENMWAAEDSFQFVWKKLTGDFTLTADISFATTGGNAHKKGTLMVRRSLAKDSDYVDAAVHGVGLTSLQSRDEPGGLTHEVQSNVTAPQRVRLVKRGDYFFMMVASAGEAFHLAGGSMKLAGSGPFYVGLAACAHDKDVVEQVLFSNVELQTGAPAAKPTLYSTLEVVPVESTDRRTVSVTEARVEAPNWYADSRWLLFNTGGHLERIAVEGGKSEPVGMGVLGKAGHHHGISPDGKTLAITDESTAQAAIFTMPLGGGDLHQVTELTPSYWKGWSPDGKAVVYTARRNGKLGIYSEPVAGGTETALPGEGDDPVYSPDGKYIYFHSERSGTGQIWRMLTDGTAQEQVTNDAFANWSPHVSPDGTQVAFLSAAPGAYPRDTDVKIRSMTLDTKIIRVIASFLGGRGSFDAQPWSGDSKSLAFVSYQLLAQ